MANLFCAEELIKMAIKIRENGRTFLFKVAQTSESKDVKETFNWLAQDQEQQIKLLNELLASLDTCEQFEQFDDEYSSYVQVIVDKHAVGKENDIPSLFDKIKTNADAIELAERFEKDGLIFLHEMSNFVREREESIIPDLIRNTQTHLLRLSRLKNCLTDSDLNACLLT